MRAGQPARKRALIVRYSYCSNPHISTLTLTPLPGKGVDDKLKTVNGKEIADTEVLIDLAKGPNNGSFMCPRCFYGCTRQRNLDEHFPKCVETYGNPDRLSNNSHPSYRGERGEEIACQPSDVEYARGWLFYVDSRSDAENAIGWCLWINPRGWYTNSRPDVVYASAWHRWFNSRKDK